MSTDSQLQEIESDPELKEQLKALVLERINVMPDTMRIAIGSTEVAKSDIIRHVTDEDEIGRQMIEMELEFLQALGSGAVYANE